MLSTLETFRPVAFFLHGIGDALLALPTLRALSSLLDKRLTLVCAREVYDLFFHELRLRACVFPDFVTFMTDDGFDPQLTEFDAEAVGASAGPCDVFIALVPWRSPCLRQLVKAVGARHSIALSEEADIAIPRRRGVHAFDHAFGVAKIFDPGVSIADFAGPPEVPPEASSQAARIATLLPENARLLLIHNETGSHKMWDRAHLLAVIAEFLDRHSDAWAVTLGIEAAWPDAEVSGLRIVQCDGLSVGASMALIGHATIFLGVDSCMLHAADLWGVPGLGLFGPTRASEFGFRFARHAHAEGADGTMRALGVAEVAGRLESLYSQLG